MHEAMPLALFVAFAGLATAPVGCITEHDVPVALEFGDLDQSSVSTFVLGVYDGDICASLQTYPLFNFTSELHRQEQRHLQVFEPGAEEPVGELEEGEYSFVGLGLDAMCMPLFSGCRSVAIEDVDEVVIEMGDLGGFAIVPFCGDLLTGGCDDGYCTDLL